MNTVLEKFRRGEKSVGTFTHMLSTTGVEALARTGLDYVVIDMEHSPIGTEGAAKCVAAAAGAGITPFVRLDEIRRSSVLKMLDVGAMGLVVPAVKTVDQVRTLVEYAKFAPAGDRGFCPTLDGGWGYDPVAAAGLEAYMTSKNHDTLLLPQCETLGCLEHIEEIAGTDGVGGIFIGPYDLSIAMGIPGQFSNQALIGAEARILRACRAAGKPCIIFTGDAAAAKAHFDAGFDSVTLGLDVLTLISGYRAQLAIALG